MGNATLDLASFAKETVGNFLKSCGKMFAHLIWRIITFAQSLTMQQQRYLASYCLGFLIGSCLFFTWQSLQYTSQYGVRLVEAPGSIMNMAPPVPAELMGGGAMEQPQTQPMINKTERRMSQLKKASDQPVSYLVSGIPKIIHQTWESTNIPTQFGEWVVSWKNNHPDWHYLFWTASGSKAMIKKRFPDIKDAYEKYPLSMQKNDARRYLILYQYGGVYADLDMESLHELDVLLQKYPCIVAQPPDRKGNVPITTDGELPYVLNSFMACRPKHKFFKIAIDMLTKYQELYPKDPLRSTGPYFLNDIMNIYLEIYNNTPADKIFVAPSSWFEPQEDLTKGPSFSQLCEQEQLLLSDQKILCDEYKSMALGRNKTAINVAFNRHYFKQTFGAHILAKDTKSLYDILEEPTVV